MLFFLLGFAHYILAAILIAGAVAAFVYVIPTFPRLGAILVAALLVAAGTDLAWQFGFQYRGRLDRSEQLQAEIAERQREAQAAKDVAARAVARANDAEARSTQLQDQVDAYEKRAPVCEFTDDAASGMRAIGGNNPAKSAAPPGKFR